MKPVLDESVIGRNHFWMKWFWMKVFLDESVVDESCFGRKCFWMSFFRIWMKVYLTISSLSEDNTQSWVRISHGSNKFVIDSKNNNNTEIPEDLPEEQVLQLKMKDFACRSKAKAKPQRREPVDYSPSIIPMNERKWIDIEPGNYSLSLRTRFRRK